MHKKYRAKLISLIFHPFILAFAGAVFVVILERQSITSSTSLVLILFFLLFVAIVSSVLLWIHRKGGLVSDIYISDKQQRNRFALLLTALILPILLIVLFLVDLTKPLQLVFSLILISGIIYALLTRFVKISAHIGVVTSIATGLSLLYDIQFLLLLLLILPIAWARYTLKHHSVVELFLGFLISIIVVLAVFLFMG